MTEDEWLTSRVGREMLHFVRTAEVHVRTRWQGWKSARRFPVSERKVRLVEAACCDRVAGLVPLAHLRGLVVLARRHAGAVVGPAERRKALEELALHVTEQPLALEGLFFGWSPAAMLAMTAIGRLFGGASDPTGDVMGLAARAGAEAFAREVPSAVHERRLHRGLDAEAAAQADIVREVIGNPFRVETIDPAWRIANDRAAMRIAEGEDFADLPVLADALEDAGCASRALLEHCRGPGPHLPGCWAVDLVLGRE